MDMTIRSFTPDDYETVVAMANAVYPGYNDTVASWKHQDASRDPKCKQARWVVETEAGPVGYGEYWQNPWIFDPDKYMLGLQVLPEHQGRGLGRALYDHIMADLVAQGGNRFLAMARADYSRSVRFLEDRGFREKMRDWESILDLATLDLSASNGAESALEAAGLRIATYRELKADPDLDVKYAELDSAVSNDMPTTEEHTPVPAEQFRRAVIESPHFLPDATLFALDGDRYVGVSVLFATSGDLTLMNGTTGVRREYRKRGIATALKLRNARWAKENGYARIRTWNEQGNRAMLGINERMGFVKQPAWISFAKDFEEDTDSIGTDARAKEGTE